MTRRLRAAAGAAFLLLAGLAAAAAAPIALAGDPCYHGYVIPASTTASTTAVSMEPCAFVPTNVRVSAGASVTFTNASQDVHLLTGANQAWGDREKEIAPGGSISVTFDEPGVYAFSCALHRGMSGAVIVGGADQAGSAGAAGGDAGGAAGGAAGGTTPTSGTGGGVDGGLIGPIAIAGLAALAALGWAAALVQRRRVVAVTAAAVRRTEAERAPVA